MDRKKIVKDLTNHKKSLLGPLFKITSINGKSVQEARNLPQIPGAVMCIGDTGGVAESMVPIVRSQGRLPRCMSICALIKKNAEKSG